jgi:hypothetical protein
MSLYPPLSPANLAEINAALESIRDLREIVSFTLIANVVVPGDEDDLHFAVSEARGRVQRLDLALFQMFGLIHRLKTSTTIEPTAFTRSRPRQVPGLDDLEEMLS